MTSVGSVPGTCDADRFSVSMTTASGRLRPPPLQPRMPLDSDDGSIDVAKVSMNASTESVMQLLATPHDGQAPDQPKTAGREVMMTGRCFKTVPSVSLAKGRFSYCLCPHRVEGTCRVTALQPVSSGLQMHLLG